MESNKQEVINKGIRYTTNLYLEHNMSRDEVRDRLVEDGISIESANKIIAIVEPRLHQEQQMREDLSGSALWDVILGLLCIGGGIALSSGGVIIFYGAVLYGVYKLFVGILKYSS
jgi:hypothetical protein